MSPLPNAHEATDLSVKAGVLATAVYGIVRLWRSLVHANGTAHEAARKEMQLSLDEARKIREELSERLAELTTRVEALEAANRRLGDEAATLREQLFMARQEAAAEKKRADFSEQRVERLSKLVIELRMKFGVRDDSDPTATPLPEDERSGR